MIVNTMAKKVEWKDKNKSLIHGAKISDPVKADKPIIPSQTK